MVSLDDSLEKSIVSLVSGESNLIANLANISASIFYGVPRLNWAGFYLWDQRNESLVLGPFQGKPACIRIKPKQGVCGKAFRTQSVQRIEDVHLFEGHIACDPESQSELVLPLIQNEFCYGVLDLDSPEKNRFTLDDQFFFEKLVQSFMPYLKFKEFSLS